MKPDPDLERPPRWFMWLLEIAIIVVLAIPFWFAFLWLFDDRDFVRAFTMLLVVYLHHGFRGST